MKAKIPVNTLHSHIHKTIDGGVPCPSESACRVVWYGLEELRLSGMIDAEKDEIEQKLDVVIGLFECCGEDVDETLKVLLAQKLIVQKFYEGG